MSVYHGDDPSLFDQALTSIVNQVLPDDVDVRIYLGVDGSIGGPLEQVLRRYSYALYREVRNPTNMGLAPTLNRLIEQLENEIYVFRMDADDRSAPDRFARQIAHMDRHPNVDILGTAITEHDVASGQRRIVRFASNPAAARRDMARRPPLAHPTACFRRTVFSTVGGYPVVPFSEDIALWFKCLEAGLHFDNLAEPLYDFTIGDQFWKRRGVRKAWNEYLTWSRGVHRLDGPTWRQLYPLARLLMRMGPQTLQKAMYRSALRRQGTHSDDRSDALPLLPG
ncbi:MAG TPA: glycosyltransferase [Sphingomicrobium sp.]|jgi:glycosyltransferase involved in cell wall biosynthesis